MYKYHKRTERLASLERYRTQEEQTIQTPSFAFVIKQVIKQKKHKGIGYHKAGAGIEKTIGSKAKPRSDWNWYHGMKGNSGVYRGLVREKSKGEINALIDGR